MTPAERALLIAIAEHMYSATGDPRISEALAGLKHESEAQPSIRHHLLVHGVNTDPPAPAKAPSAPNVVAEEPSRKST